MNDEIKQPTVKKKTVKKTAVRKKAVKKSASKKVTSSRTYINKSKFNVFTENGRVHPNDTIVLTTEEAKNHPSLKEV